MCLSLGTALPFYQLSLAQLSLSLFSLFYLSCLCIPKLRPASRNMAQHCGSKSHDHPSPNPLCFSHPFQKSRLRWTCAHAQCRIQFFRHVEFYFRFRQLISFLVWGQLYCACLGEESSTIFQVINDAPYIVTCPQFGGYCHLHCWAIFWGVVFI